MVEFAELVRTESRGLIAAVYAILGDAHRSEEIVQDAFERCYMRWGRVSRLDKPGAWTRRVAINAAISAARRSNVEHRALERYEARLDSITASADPLALLADDDIWAAVRALPRDQATAVALRYGADLSIDEVASTMRTTASAVKSLLHRARAELRSSTTLAAYTP